MSFPQSPVTGGRTRGSFPVPRNLGSDPRRLLYLLDYAPRGTRTLDDFIHALSRRMTDDGWEVTLAFGRPPAPGFSRQLARLGARWLAAPFPFTRRSARQLVAELAGERPDVLLTSFLSPFTWPVLALKAFGYARRLVVIDHASSEAPVRHGVGGLMALGRGWLVGRLVDAIVPVSEANARRATGRVFLPARKVRVVPNGVEIERFPPAERPVGHTVTIAFAAQLIPEKGAITLLRAAERLRDRGARNVDWLVAGDGPQAADLRAFCADRRLDRVSFLGHVDDMPALLARADVVVVPSVWAEAFGLVTIEAMATGAAVVVSDSGALPEIVRGAGLVFPAGDDAALADRLVALVRSPELRRQLGRAARRRVEERYTLDRRVARLAGLCAELTAPRCADSTSPWSGLALRRGVLS
jgi:L-malate glycosyltransferase